MLALIIPIEQPPSTGGPPTGPGKPGQPSIDNTLPSGGGLDNILLPTNPIVIMPPSTKPLPPGAEVKPPGDKPGPGYVYFYIPGIGGKWVKVGGLSDLIISTLPAEPEEPDAEPK